MGVTPVTQRRVSLSCATSGQRKRKGPAFCGPFSVGPAPINSNHRSPARVAAPDLDVPWSDGRQDNETRAQHARRTGLLHGNPSFHRAALRGLAKGHRQRQWSNSAILTAIQDFHDGTGRWPSQSDFRSANGLPGVGTVQRRFGSRVHAMQQAKRCSAAKPSKQASRGQA